MPPLGLLIKPASSLCNMRCSYCFYADVADHRDVKSYGIMSENTLETLIRKALVYADGHCAFVFQGGEPTLAGLPYFKEAIRLQKKHNTKQVRISNSLQTNGLLIDDEWAIFLKENHFLVGLSIDGDKATHDFFRLDTKKEGTFSRVQKAASVLKQHGCNFNILCVVTSRTAKHAAKTYTALKKYHYLQFIPCIEGFGQDVNPYVLTSEAYGAFLNATFDLYYRDYLTNAYVSVRQFDNYVHMLLGDPPENCAMQGRCACNLVVEGDGSIYPCDFYVLDEFRLGNIHTDSITDMLQSDESHVFTNKSLCVHPDCLQCKWRSLCRGGCRRDREAQLDSPLQKNRFCKAYRIFFEKNFVLLTKLARHEASQRNSMTRF